MIIIQPPAYREAWKVELPALHKAAGRGGMMVLRGMKGEWDLGEC